MRSKQQSYEVQGRKITSKVGKKVKRGIIGKTASLALRFNPVTGPVMWAKDAINAGRKIKKGLNTARNVRNSAINTGVGYVASKFRR